MSPESLVIGFDALVRNHPTSLVAAVTPEGIFVPMPASFGVDRARVLHGRSALDLVIADDRQVVIDGWTRAREIGGCRIGVRFPTAPEQVTSMHFFDLMEKHGVFACVAVMPDGVTGPSSPDLPAGLTTRVTWTKKNDNATFVDTDPNLWKILGWRPEDLQGERALNYIHPDDQELAIDNWMTMLAAAGDGQRVRLRHIHKDGHYVWVEIANKNLLDDPDDPHVIAQMIDISDEMAANEALREREQLLNRLAEALPSGLLHVRSDRTVVYTNERLHEIVGVPRSEQLDDQLRTILRDDWGTFDSAFAAAMDGADSDLETRLHLPGATDERLCHISLRSLTESDGTVNAAIVSVADVTESAALREELRRRATFDALTGCHNRASVMGVLEEAVGDTGERIAVVFLDLDRFKAINDELGHAAGDELLTVTADRLRSVVRGDDIVGRLGGDEFIVVCPRVSSTDEAIDIAERVASVLRREVELACGLVDMRASVGVAWTTGEVTTADELVARADAAMYESKRRGVGRPVAYAPALRKTDNVKLDDERALHHALERGDLQVHFQPIVELSSGNSVGYESLVRWSRGSYGVAASEFIQMAEETGLIHALGTRVRAELVRNVVESRQITHTDSLWFCNVSVQELQMPGIVESILHLIDEHELERNTFVVEFKCAVSSDELHSSAQALTDLHAAGLGIAVDDFGAGSTSLDVLRAVPLSWVKVAPTFTAEMTSNDATAAIVESMLALASRLDITAVVKGIETAEQRKMALEMGAKLGQGHYFAPAAPLSSLRHAV